MKKRITWLIVFAAAVAGVWAVSVTSTGLAQKATPSDDEVNAIARQLYCPVCENIPLDVCPTQACAQWRAVIREKLAEGWTETQIKDYFVEQYGVRVLNEPPRQGLGWLIYIVPALFLIAGAVVLIRLFRRWQTPAPAPAGTPPALGTSATSKDAGEAGGDGGGDDDYMKRFEEQAGKRK